MFRAAIRSTPRALRQSSAATSSGRRFASTAPADKRYSWKGSATRWGLAVGALYWYNTSPIFADELPARLPAEPPQFSVTDDQTVDAIVAEKRKQLDARRKAKDEQASKQVAVAQNATPQQTTPQDKAAVAAPTDGEKSPEQLEEEAGQQGAFNPETGEINWDCPCLGGMAHGPCGEEFKAAFSCFVYSTEEPKGMDCIDRFQHMQDCFRKHPDVYGAEIADEEAAEKEAEEIAKTSPAVSGDLPEASAAKPAAPAPAPAPAKPAQPAQPATPAKEDKKPAESHRSALTPKTAEDNTTKEIKKAPADAPKGASVVATANDDEPKQISRADLAGEERGLPTRSFDATSANRENPK